MSDSYAVGRRNKVRQLSDKAAYDRQTIHRILDSALIAHVAFVENGQPVVVPMLFGRDGETVYLHGARKARVVRLLESTSTACLNITHIDGLVFARSAFNSSLNYRSATLFGSPRLITDDADKLRALRIITEHAMPGRWAELRAPLERELKMTGVIAVEIESASAKVASKMPEDEPEDYATPVWAGVLPIESRCTALQPDDRLKDGVTPSDALRRLEGKQF
jgi:nitroimidazol reductase NimA-like FMN-containing flavoprotein (pyridoxamine 5'-phosphate oxidase superfamily)